MRFLSNKSQRGNAIVEFALVFPVLALITIGIVDLGRYAYFAIGVSNAARAGAAYGSINNKTVVDNTGMIAAAQADATGLPGSVASPVPTELCYQWDSTTHTQTSVSCASSSINGNIIPYAQVTVSGSMQPLIRYPFVPGTIHVSSTAQMRVQCGSC